MQLFVPYPLTWIVSVARRTVLLVTNRRLPSILTCLINPHGFLEWQWLVTVESRLEERGKAGAEACCKD
jgi:hypothetical protein